MEEFKRDIPVLLISSNTDVVFPYRPLINCRVGCVWSNLFIPSRFLESKNVDPTIWQTNFFVYLNFVHFLFIDFLPFFFNVRTPPPFLGVKCGSLMKICADFVTHLCGKKMGTL